MIPILVRPQVIADEIARADADITSAAAVMEPEKLLSEAAGRIAKAFRLLGLGEPSSASLHVHAATTFLVAAEARIRSIEELEQRREGASHYPPLSDDDVAAVIAARPSPVKIDHCRPDPISGMRRVG